MVTGRLWNAKRMAQVGIGLIVAGCLPLLFVFTVPASTASKVAVMNLAQTVLPYEFWAMIACYLSAKSLLLWHAWKKHRPLVREQAPWVIALMVLLLVVSVSAHWAG